MGWLFSINSAYDIIYDEEYKHFENYKFRRCRIIYCLRIYVTNFLANNNNKCIYTTC